MTFKENLNTHQKKKNEIQSDIRCHKTLDRVLQIK